MTDSSGGLEASDTEARPKGTAAEGMPMWVKASLAVALALVLLFVVAKLTGLGGEHGPGRHDRGGHPPATVVDDNGGHRVPAEHRP